jgi:hypothetical protein
VSSDRGGPAVARDSSRSTSDATRTAKSWLTADATALATHSGHLGSDALVQLAKATTFSLNLGSKVESPLAVQGQQGASSSVCRLATYSVPPM